MTVICWMLTELSTPYVGPFVLEIVLDTRDWSGLFFMTIISQRFLSQSLGHCFHPSTPRCSYPLCSPTGSKWKLEQDKDGCFHHRITPCGVVPEAQAKWIQAQRWRGHIPGHSNGKVALLGATGGHWDTRDGRDQIILETEPGGSQANDSIASDAPPAKLEFPLMIW